MVRKGGDQGRMASRRPGTACVPLVSVPGPGRFDIFGHGQHGQRRVRVNQKTRPSVFAVYMYFQSGLSLHGEFCAPCSLPWAFQINIPTQQVPWLLDVLRCAARTFSADSFWCILRINWLILLVTWFKKEIDDLELEGIKIQDV